VSTLVWPSGPEDGYVDFIDGFSFRGYRSFPSERVAELYPLSKINLIAGQNNAGKSLGSMSS
jgi:hypothetical protein